LFTCDITQLSAQNQASVRVLGRKYMEPTSSPCPEQTSCLSLAFWFQSATSTRTSTTNRRLSTLRGPDRCGWTSRWTWPLCASVGNALSTSTTNASATNAAWV